MSPSRASAREATFDRLRRDGFTALNFARTPRSPEAPKTTLCARATPNANAKDGLPGTGRWSDDEHGRFLAALEIYADHPRRWEFVAQRVESRSLTQVRCRATRLLKGAPMALNLEF